MIRWLIESIDAHPDLLHGEAPVGLLGAPEQAALNAFKVLKRRQDWLIGRWTAKQLVQTHLTDTTGTHWPLAQLHIQQEAGGAPYVTILDSPQERLLPVSLSISHSHGYAFCALYDAQQDESIEPTARAAAAHKFHIGADIEYVEQRERSFVTDFFTESEMAAIEQMAPAQQDRLVTALWSAKEAVLKALRIGLRVDTRRIQCTFIPRPNAVIASNEWQPFTIEAVQLTADHFTGWWRTLDDFVLTLAVRGEVQT